MSSTEILTLFGETFEPPDRELTAEEKFSVFHVSNPHVYRELVKLTASAHARGRKKIGIKMLFEILRWNYYMATDDPNSEFKINNNYAPFYARLIMSEQPEFDGIFELREMR